MTHAELVQRAVQWLLTTGKCCFVVRDQGTRQEVADALGFQWKGHVILIECKASRSDFLRDQDKISRISGEGKSGCGMGNLRYYMAPPGMILPEELPGRWGLLECHPKIIKAVRKPDSDNPFFTDVWTERQLLLRNLAFRPNDPRAISNAQAHLELSREALKRLDKRELRAKNKATLLARRAASSAVLVPGSPWKCEHCGKELEQDEPSKYCSRSCCAKASHVNRKMAEGAQEGLAGGVKLGSSVGEPQVTLHACVGCGRAMEGDSLFCSECAPAREAQR